MTQTESLVRQAIFDVIDGGCKGEYWKFYLGHFDADVDKSEIDFQRLDFADAVVARLRQLEEQR